MALLAEEIIEEWLNRQGYFTIRGIRLGVNEIDLVAVKFRSGEKPVCRHIEVQASMRPVSYISKLPKAARRTGRAANSAARSQEELVEGVAEWVERKFHATEKRALMETLWSGEWSSELVINKVKSEQEVELIAQHGTIIHRLPEIVRELQRKIFPIKRAAGSDFIDLLQMGATHNKTL
ncbi:hypothetical protein [Halorhodospira sp. 9622]|uniref:hypothetical protein n=1 Tax=Halorhodospira sp. 9622 TaxID=2899136 RepID=UPI001EE8C5F5|nr:hypothetical protein [Halorhodospira sp. 9622]MCG5539323.1 hypothetical protein [Halorhodospira sp. 9622]